MIELSSFPYLPPFHLCFSLFFSPLPGCPKNAKTFSFVIGRPERNIAKSCRNNKMEQQQQQDVNDNRPVFQPFANTLMLRENAPPAVILTVEATDRDQGVYGQVTYRTSLSILLLLFFFLEFSFHSSHAQLEVYINITHYTCILFLEEGGVSAFFFFLSYSSLLCGSRLRLYGCAPVGLRTSFPFHYSTSINTHGLEREGNERQEMEERAAHSYCSSAIHCVCVITHEKLS